MSRADGRAWATTPDHALLAGCLDGRRSALAAFVERFARLVHHSVAGTLRRSRGEVDARRIEDLCQDVFVALLADDCRRLRLYRGDRGCSLASWVRVIAVRTTLNRLRRDRPLVSLDGERAPRLADPGPDPLDVMLARADRDRFEALIALAEQLSDRDRLLLEMYYLRGMKAPAIAAALRVDRSVIYVRKNRLLGRLRKAAEAAGMMETAP